MSNPIDQASNATKRFVAKLASQPLTRVQVKVASPDGMPLLCAAEAALAEALPAQADRELVWLTGGQQAGVHSLRLVAYAKDNRLLAEALHEF